jgi:hypothetical protein
LALVHDIAIITRMAKRVGFVSIICHYANLELGRFDFPITKLLPDQLSFKKIKLFGLIDGAAANQVCWPRFAGGTKNETQKRSPP